MAGFELVYGKPPYPVANVLAQTRWPVAFQEQPRPRRRRHYIERAHPLTIRGRSYRPLQVAIMLDRKAKRDALHADYYAQRASAGLIISEGVFVSPTSVGWADVPGLWTEAQVRAWRPVTDAVHKESGRMQERHRRVRTHDDFPSKNTMLITIVIGARS